MSLIKQNISKEQKRKRLISFLTFFYEAGFSILFFILAIASWAGFWYMLILVYVATSYDVKDTWEYISNNSRLFKLALELSSTISLGSFFCFLFIKKFNKMLVTSKTKKKNE